MSSPTKHCLTDTIHVTPGKTAGHLPLPLSSVHLCFVLPSSEALQQLEKRIWEHSRQDGASAAQQCDEPINEDPDRKVSFKTREGLQTDQPRSAQISQRGSSRETTLATGLNLR
jgi:hypothetical protein